MTDRPDTTPVTAPQVPVAAPRARSLGPADRLRAWLVTGALGRGVAFAIDFAFALRDLIRSRRRR